MKKFRLILTLPAVMLAVSLKGQNLHQMACQGDLARLDSLMGDTISINVLDRYDRSLLHYAVACQQEQVFNYLIEKGIDINIEENRGWTPLLLAILNSNQEYIKLLQAMDAKANYNHTDPHGTSVLMTAVLNGNLSAVKLLIENGANVNDVNERGSSPLSIAQREGLVEIADFLISKGAKKSNEPTPKLKGDYMGQEEPGRTPKMFAPGVVSTESRTQNAVFHPNGKEFYYTVESRRTNGGTIMVSKMNKKVWSKPAPMDISGEYREVDPFISPDGMKLYYCTDRPLAGSDSVQGHVDIWVMDRNGDSWGEPVRLSDEINTDYFDWFPSVSENGNFYYSSNGNVYYSELKNGIYQKAEWISVNSNHVDYDPFIAPDESYLIFASNRSGGIGGNDLYISFKEEDGSWATPKNMGASINSESTDFAPSLSPDGKYFFFSSGKEGSVDVYWVDSNIITELK